jgi:hypothetical protein
MRALDLNRRHSDRVAVESSPVGSAICAMLNQKPLWEGTISALLSKMRSIAESQCAGVRELPTTARALGGALRRLTPPFRGIGINVKFLRRTERGICVRLEWEGKKRTGNTGEARAQRRTGGPERSEHCLVRHSCVNGAIRLSQRARKNDELGGNNKNNDNNGRI